MNQHATSAAFQPHRIETRQSRVDALSEPAMTEERLPFTVRLVRDEDDLDKAVQIRHSAYARHLPVFAESLKAAETADADNGVVVLLAESKLDGSPLGTMRIQTNQFKPLCLEQSVELPAWLKARPLAEATRLGVTNEKGGRLVTTMLFKAFFQYCQQTGIEWMVVTGRAPVDRTYDRLLFEDVFPGRGYIPFSHVGNLPHRVMSFNVETAEVRWAAAKHPLFDFIFRTHHPDLDIGGQHQAFISPLARPTFPAHPAAFSM
ncbi:MAG: hypothetical protein Q7T21_02685 [Gallionella sp.]|nr:hypothetical protein [Gallionella sp.]